MKDHRLALRGHAVLSTQVTFGLRLTCRTGLHIGAGRSPEMVGSDLPVMRDAAGRPLIPGSSLRGVLRSGVEALLRSLALVPPVPTAPKATSKPNPRGGPRTTRPLATDWEDMCLVERLFGRVPQDARDRVGAYASRVHLSDLLAEGRPVVELRDGVAISRETRTVAGAAKYDLEVVPAGTVFEGRVRLVNPADHEVGLVAQALEMLDHGLLLLGGKSARGLGWVEVEVTPPSVLDAKALLAGALRPKEDPTFGPVRDRLGSYLDSLEALVRELGTDGSAVA